MLDIRLIRDDAELVKARLAGRDASYGAMIDEVLAADEGRREAETEKQRLQGERKRASKEIGALKGKGEDTSEAEAKVRAIGEEISAIGQRADEADGKQRDLLLSLPNLPHEACPVGEDETANPEVRVWGEKPELGFEAKDHVELGTELGILDFESATKISGSGFVVFRGAGAKLERALIQYLLDVHTGEHGYEEVSPPFIVRRECMVGTGQLPKFAEEAYAVAEGSMYLVPTAEVPVTNLYREQIVTGEEMPIKVTAYTPCFRTEAGAAGKDTRGMIRVHQFDKVEMVNVVHPDESFAQLETLTGEAERILQSLGLHYRVIELCTGDLGFSSAKTYDIEVWAPGQGRYLEVSSCSNFMDYQARRMNLRFKDEDGKNRFCHTLNGSGTALPRLVVALLETYQRADGTIEVPEVLRGHFGSESIG
jgi:seryl-tRNA synthetase